MATAKRVIHLVVMLGVMQCKLMTKKNKQATHKTAKFVYMYKCVNHDAPPPLLSSSRIIRKQLPRKAWARGYTTALSISAFYVP